VFASSFSGPQASTLAMEARVPSPTLKRGEPRINIKKPRGVERKDPAGSEQRKRAFFWRVPRFNCVVVVGSRR